jgi:PAS domain S-box-containing protein
MTGKKDRGKSKDELITDLAELRLRVASLERVEGAIKRAELVARAARDYAENIVETVREPLIVLDSDLKVLSANQSFYDTFKVTPKESIGNLIYDLGNSQWDIPKLRTLLQDILPKDRKFQNFEVDHIFSSIGHRIMLLNARRVQQEGIGSELILLAIEDITERKRLENELKDSEERFRRVFETAKDGLLLIDKQTENIVNVNPAIIKLLGYSSGELIGKKLQDVGILHGIKDSKETIEEVIEYGFINYDDVSVETKEGDCVDAEIYFVDRARFIQCNVRNITERKKAEDELSVQTRYAVLGAEVGSILVRSKDLRSLLQLCTEAIVKHLDAAFGRIWTLNERDNVLELQASAGMYTHINGPHARVPVGKFKIGLIAQERRPHLTNAVFDDPRIGDPEWAKQEGIVAFAGHPLIVADKLVGVMAMFSKKPLTETTLTALSSIADEIALGIERKGSEERISRQIKKLSSLHSIDLAITSNLDLRVTLKVFIEHVITQLAVDAADVVLLNPHTMILEYAASQGFRTSALKHSHLRLGEGYAGVAALENRIVSIPDLKGEDSAFKRLGLVEGEDFITYYGIPLVAKGHVKGVLEIFHRSSLQPDEEWFEFLEGLALQAAIAIDNNSLFYDLERSNMDLSLAYDSTIEGWSRALDYRDKETEGHSQRVTELTIKIAREMGMSEEELVHVRRGALLHDIGKMGIPDSILLKPGPLTEEEWKIMKLHPVYSYDLLHPIAYLRPALDVPYCHHEKWDGTGYPRGLKGEQIPLSARIFSVVDVWDALRSDRPYRPAWSEEKTTAYVRSLSGIQFDPNVIDVFFKIQP